MSAPACSFCRQPPPDDTAIVVAAHGPAICERCLGLAVEAVAERRLYVRIEAPGDPRQYVLIKRVHREAAA
jgi:hypothetical protein